VPGARVLEVMMFSVLKGENVRSSATRRSRASGALLEVQIRNHIERKDSNAIAACIIS
jgi:hypothetical protein